MDSRRKLLRDVTGRPKATLTINTDLTEKKQFEAQYLRTQRLESIGTLASGVAHDLNNALAPILMGTELLRAQYPQETKMIDIMGTCAQRGADMVRQLLTFAKGAGGGRILLQPLRPLKEMEKLIKGAFPGNILLQTSYAKNLQTILGDTTQLHQVLLNLCVNARDAMPNGGTLTLEAENVELDAAGAVAVPNAKPGHYVVWRVKDSGTGIPPEILTRIFEPFFTTKGPEKGTGLGLSSVFVIVKSHGGAVQVYSTPGEGTSFSVYLPADTGNPAPETDQRMNRSFRGNGELILVVDDEAAVCQVIRAILIAMNFHVVTARNGMEALIQVGEHREELRAVITDLHMPHMDGLTLVRTLKRVLPRAVIIVTSGRLDEREASEVQALGVSGRLDKPFTQEKLVELLGAALHEAAAATIA